MDYTHCSPVSSSIGASFNSCAEYIICKRDCNSTIDNNCRNFLGFNLSDSCRQHPTCQCQVNITLDRPLRSTVHVYYGIKNYYQNHRRYLNSLDVEQLHGDLNKVPNDDCRPLVLDEDRNDSRIVPCGLIANSLFNGECSLTYMYHTFPSHLKMRRPPFPTLCFPSMWSY